MRLFDVYFAVDWSARNTPGPATPTHDALWVGERLAPGISQSEPTGETYWRTRQSCMAHIRARLLHHTEARRRIFLGFDFPYGYPSGTATAFGLNSDAPPWRRMWNELSHLVVDDAANGNNRFQVAAALNARCGGAISGPFWGRPVGTSFPTLLSKSPAYPYAVRYGLALERLRLVERLERGTQPVWKLYGTGSVGGQALVGIPVVCQLRDDLTFTKISRVWPFETGFTPLPTPEQGPFILHAEIWPSIVPGQLDPTLAIRDQAQVRAVVNWLAELDANGQLGGLFSTPSHLSAHALNACIEEEGWILGGDSRTRTCNLTLKGRLLYH